MDPYKLNVKIGDAVFNGEGSEPSVREDYANFLKILEKSLDSTASMAPANSAKASDKHGDNANGEEPQLDKALLQRVFQVDSARGVVSLRLLPPEGPDRASSAAILLLYGFRGLLQQREVPVIKLNAGLRESGIQIDRLDRVIDARYALKGGVKSGGRYTLNNMGAAQAETWVKEWFN